MSNTLETLEIRQLARVLAYSRPWHYREQRAYKLHPVAIALAKLSRPRDWHRLVLEWPHQSVNDPARVAYTQTARKGADDIQTVMAAGKYFTRFWPHLPSSVIRDAVAGFIAEQEDSCKFLDATTEEIVRSVQEGPRSCMRWDECEIERAGAHPYEAYAPELGWRAAVRMKGPSIVGRALVHDGTNMRSKQDSGRPVVVRSFKCANDEPHTTEYSYSDEKLEAWLREQGVAKQNSWPEGTPLARVEAATSHSYDFVLPYIDGGRQVVSTASSKAFFIIDGDENGADEEDAFMCNETGGGYECVGSRRSSCDHCGSYVDDDDLTYVESRDESICDHCLRIHFTHTDYHGWVHDSRVERSVEGETWDSEKNTPDEMVCLDSGQYEGQYTHVDNAIWDIHGEYWHEQDAGRYVVQLSNDSVQSNEYAPVDDCVEVDGDNYLEHEDAEAGNIVKVTRGLSEGEWALPDDVKTDIEGGLWRVEDEWRSDADDSLLAPFSPIVPGRRGEFYVTLHDEANEAGEIICVSDAILVQGVGWFLQEDLEAETIACLGDGLYVLSTDFALV